MGLFSDLLGAGGAILGGVVGGPVGAQIGGALGGALAGSSGSSKATAAQLAAIKQAQDAAKQAYGDVKGYQQPYVDFGSAGMNALSGRLGLTLPAGGGAQAAPSGTATAGPSGLPSGPTSIRQMGPTPVSPDYANTDSFRTDPNGLAASGLAGVRPTGEAPLPAGVTPTAISGQGGAGVAPALAPPPAPVATNALTGAPNGPPDPGTFGSTANPTEPTPYSAPPPPGAFSYSLADYKASPAYQWQLSQALNGVLSTAGATGALHSGAALKELSDRAENVALGDFNNERNFNYGVSRDVRGDYNGDRAFNYGQSRDARSDYQNNRDYLTNRSDTQTNNLFRTVGVGQTATNALSDAATHYGDQNVSLVTGAGNVQAGNALRQGQIGADLATTVGGIVSGYGGFSPAAPANALSGAAGVSPTVRNAVSNIPPLYSPVAY